MEWNTKHESTKPEAITGLNRKGASMKTADNDIGRIQKLVGGITLSNLKYVDYYVGRHLGIFIPSVGFCEYAIMPQHTHPAYSFILYFSEEQSFVPVEIPMQDEHYLCTALSPGVPHEEKESDDFTRYIAIMIAQDFFDDQYSQYSKHPPEQYIWKQFLVEQDIMHYLKKFMTEYEERTSGSDTVLEAVAALTTHQLIRNILNIKAAREFVAERFEIQKTLEFMLQNYGKKIAVKDMAKLANMSESNYIRLFKKEAGMAPMEYLIKLRLDKAKKLLRTGSKTITEISLQCGFSSTSHFSSSFSKHLGITPSEYQNSYLEG